MAATRKCTQGRNKSGVAIDVTGKQEYLRYRACITKGARNDAVIVDENERIILDENHGTSNRCRVREWPAQGQSVDLGVHEHTLVLTFIRAVEYSYRVTVHNEDGSIKEWIKDCAYTRTTQTDHRAVGLTILVQ